MVTLFAARDLRNMTSEEEIVTMLKDLNAKVDTLQKNQADIIDRILNTLKQRWKDEQARRRERCW